MMRICRLVFALALASLPGSVLHAAVPPQERLEQRIEEPRNEDPNWNKGWTNIVPPNRVGQTFVARASVIRRVDVNILTTENRSGPEDTLTLTILDENGNPIGVASQVVRAGFDGWLSFTFARPNGLRVNPGARLRLWLRDTGKVLFGWRYGLDRYHSGISFMGGKEDPRFDFLFRIEPSLALGAQGVEPQTPEHHADPCDLAANRDLCAELVVIGEKYEKARRLAPPNRCPDGPADSAEMDEVCKIDSENLRRVKQIIDRFGWPDERLVGWTASLAASSVIQTADLSTMESAIPLMMKADEAGKSAAFSTAIEIDKRRLAQGRPQLYGTQFHEVNGEPVFEPIEDPAHVDERRASVKFRTLADYAEATRQSKIRRDQWDQASSMMRLQQVARAIERFRVANGRYPTASSMAALQAALSNYLFHQASWDAWTEPFLVDATSTSYTLTSRGSNRTGNHSYGGAVRAPGHAITLKDGRFVQYDALEEKRARELENELAIAHQVPALRAGEMRWYPYEARDGAFRVRFPGNTPLTRGPEPMITWGVTGEEDANFALRPSDELAVAKTCSVYVRGAVFMIAVIETNRKEPKFTADALDDYPDMKAAGIDGKIVSNSDIQMGPYVGRATRMEGSVDGGLVIHVERALVAGGRIFVATVVTKPGRALPEIAGQFLDSFEIVR